MSISIHSLRICNLVKCKKSNDSRAYKVEALDGLHLKCMLNGVRHGIWYPESDLKPIPLTDAWLTKFGFFKFNNAWVLKEPSSDMRKFDFSIWGLGELRYNTAEIVPPLEYVHTLQNLFFALTGEELKITE